MRDVSRRHCHYGIVAVFGLGLAFAAVYPVLAQAPAADPKFEAAKTAYEAVSDNGRKAIQEALIWSGDYSGIVDGSFGRRTYDAILAFEKRSKLKADGIIDAKEREALDTAAQKARQAVEFRSFTDPRNGLKIGVPGKILGKTTATALGTRLASGDGSASLETLSFTGAAADLADLFEKNKAESGSRKVTYKVLQGDFFVVSGEEQGRQFYTRIAKGADGLRGFTFSYRVNRKAELDRVTIAIANAFVPFPEASRTAEPVDSAAAPPGFLGSGVVVAPGRVLTIAAVEDCAEPLIGMQKASLVRADKASGLALLEGQAPKALAAAGLDTRPQSHDGLVVVGFAGLGGTAPVASVVPGEAAVVQDQLRVLAPLQRGAGGSVVLDRVGRLVGVVAGGGPELRAVAGVVPQASHPVVTGADIGKFLAAANVSLPTGEKPAARSTGEIVASVAPALVAIACKSSPKR
jgi:peptidoglycan hydrolase-like protein with peptidoglycan-binding domain